MNTGDHLAKDSEELFNDLSDSEDETGDQDFADNRLLKPTYSSLNKVRKLFKKYSKFSVLSKLAKAASCLSATKQRHLAAASAAPRLQQHFQNSTATEAMAITNHTLATHVDASDFSTHF